MKIEDIFQKDIICLECNMITMLFHFIKTDDNQEFLGSYFFCEQCKSKHFIDEEGNTFPLTKNMEKCFKTSDFKTYQKFINQIKL